MSESDFTSGDIAQADKPVADASPASAPQTAPATADASTTASPAAHEKPADQFGPVPWERHELILNNTRRDYEGKLGNLSWAERLKREEVEQAMALRDLARRDPQALVSHLSQRTPTQPKPDARDERGEAFYSPEGAMALANFVAEQAVAKVRQELGERLGPIESERESRQRQDALYTDVVTGLQLPGASQYLNDMTAFVTEMNARRARGEQIPVMTMRDVYDRVVLPKLSDTSTARQAELKKQWLAELNDTSVRAKDDINPQRLPAASRKADKDRPLGDIVREEIDKARRAS